MNDASLKKRKITKNKNWPAGINWAFTTNINITCVVRLSQFFLQRAHEDHRKLWRPPRVRRRQQARRGRLRHRIQRSPERQTCCSEKAHTSKWQILTSQSRAVGDLVNCNLSYCLPLDGWRLPGRAASSVRPRDPDSESVRFIFSLCPLLIPRLLLGFRLTATS